MRNSMKLGCVVAVLALAGSAMDGGRIASAKRARTSKVRAPAKSTAAPAAAPANTAPATTPVVPATAAPGPAGAAAAGAAPAAATMAAQPAAAAGGPAASAPPKPAAPAAPPGPRPAPGSVVVSTLLPAPDAAGYKDGVGAAAQFDGVQGAALIGGELYVSDAGNALIRRVTLASGEVATAAGKQRDGRTVNGSLAEARFYKPGPMVAVGRTLYIIQLATEHGGACIRSLDLDAGSAATLTGDCQRRGNLDGGKDAALFSSPTALATDGQNLYVGDYVRVRMVALASGAVTTLVGEADAQCDFGLQRICKGGFVEGVGNQARLIGIRALALSGRTLYVADGEAIRALDLEARRLTTVIGAAKGIGSDDGVGVKAGVSSVTGLSPEAGGLYILQGPNFAGLRHLNLTTKALVSLTGQTIPGFARGSGNVDGPAAKADFSKPKLLVADGNRLLIIHQQGRIRTFEKF